MVAGLGSIIEVVQHEKFVYHDLINYLMYFPFCQVDTLRAHDITLSVS